MRTIVMERMGRVEGHAVAFASSMVLLAAGLTSITMTLLAAKYIVVDYRDLHWVANATRLPLLVQLSWFLMTLGVAGCVVSIAIYGFNARWFWRVMVLACCLLLFSPSILALAGLFGLVTLIAARRKFSRIQVPPLRPSELRAG